MTFSRYFKNQSKFLFLLASSLKTLQQQKVAIPHSPEAATCFNKTIKVN